MFLFYENLGKGDSMAKKKEKKVEKTEKMVKVKEKEERVSFWNRFIGFFHGVKTEGKRIHWTTKKDLVRYSVATLIFVVFFSLFFYLVNLVYAFIHSLIG